MNSHTFFFNDQPITVFEVLISGIRLLSMNCDLPTEMHISRLVGAKDYPYTDFDLFLHKLNQHGLSNVSGNSFDDSDL